MRPLTRVALLAAAFGAALVSCTVVGGDPSGDKLHAAEWRLAKAEMYRDLALQCVRAGDSERARRLLGQAVDYDRVDAGALRLLLRLAHGDGDLAEASQAARLLLEVEPEATDAWCVLGAIAAAEGRWDDAERVFRRATATPAAGPEPWLDLLRLYRQQEREPAAAAVAAQLASRFGDRVEVWLDRGAALAAGGDWGEAAAAYRRAYELEPRHQDASARYVLSAVVGERAAEAVAFGRALPPRSRLDNPELTLALVAAHAKAGDSDNALAELQLLDVATLARPRIRLLRAELLLALDRREEARQELEAATAADPALAGAHAALARVHLAAGRAVAGIRALRAAIAADPRDPVPHALLAAALAERGEIDAARRHLGHAQTRPGADRLVQAVVERYPALSAREGPEDER
ncbi:MAG: tetratricopeptide repeat protein [Planctomycetota bacterium]